MDIKGAVALVTGGNRGVGRSFVEALAARGAKKVYVGTRKISAVKGWTIAGCELVPVKLDVTKPDDIKAAAKLAKDVTILVNNAGINHSNRLVEAKKKNAAQLEMDTNYFGMVAMARAFAPVIAKNGGGAIVNLLSILALVNMPGMGSYSASKAAAHSASQAMRAEFAARNIHVLSVLPGVMDTDMMAHYPPPKLPPAEAVREALDALAAGEWEVYPGDMAKGMQQGHKADPIALHKQMMQYL